MEKPKYKFILDLVADLSGTSVSAIQGPKRKQSICWPRFVAVYLIRNHCSMTWKDIGRLLNNRDHSTAMYAYRKGADLVRMPFLNPECYDIIVHIENQLNHGKESPDQRPAGQRERSAGAA